MCLNESTFECFCCSSVCATVRLLSDINPKGDHSVGIKVDSGAGGNDMLRCVFPQLHPAKLTLNGHPLGLEPSLTQLKLTTGRTYQFTDGFALQSFGSLDQPMYHFAVSAPNGLLLTPLDLQSSDYLPAMNSES